MLAEQLEPVKPSKYAISETGWLAVREITYSDSGLVHLMHLE